MRLSFPEYVLPRGVVELPPSKSIANRLLIMAALSRRLSEIPRQDNEAKDTSILRQLIHDRREVWDVEMAGTAARFLAAYLAVKPGKRLLIGAPRMCERPISPLVDALKALGAQTRYMKQTGFLPMLITGKTLKGGEVSIAGDISSQFISALLLVAPYFKEGLRLKILPPFYSEPYIKMTVALMKAAGAEVEDLGREIIVQPGEYSGSFPAVERDWSAAAFFYTMVALRGRGEVLLKGLQKDSLQGDAIAEKVYRKLGVQTQFTEKGALLTGNPSRQLPEKLEIDSRDFPDLVQPLATACAGLKIPVHFTGVKSLYLKETNRLAAMGAELAKLGVRTRIGEDEFAITHFEEPWSTSISTYNDHRMAMAFAPLSMVFEGVKIRTPEVVSKSFPDFWNQFIGVLKF